MAAIVFVWPEGGQMYVQRKPTMYPPWNSTFDAHITKGRVMQIMVKGRNADLISETTVELASLADRCRKNNGKTEIWVRTRALPQQNILLWRWGRGHQRKSPFQGKCRLQGL